MENMYPKVFEMARQYSLPMIDLPNTFDPRCSDLFCSQIEPSALGSSLIAHMIAHTLKNWDRNSSVFFSCLPGNYKKIPKSTDVDIEKIECIANEPSHHWNIKPLPDIDAQAWDSSAHENSNDEEEQDLELKFSS